MDRIAILSIVGVLAIAGVAFGLSTLTSDAPADDPPAAADTSFQYLGMDAWRAALAKTPDAVILDVRMDHEFADGHIPGAVNLWVETLSKERKLDLDKDEPIFLYCKLGIRATRAAGILDEMGFTNVVVFTDGGFPDWAAAGYPVVRGQA